MSVSVQKRRSADFLVDSSQSFDHLRASPGRAARPSPNFPITRRQLSLTCFQAFPIPAANLKSSAISMV
jgi:hypothetical protein